MSAICLETTEMVDYLSVKCKEDVIKNNLKPVLAIVVAGGYSPASTVYVRNKIRLAEKFGVEVKLFDLDWEGVDKVEFRKNLFSLVDDLNRDDSISGIICQLPIPHGISEDEISDRISPMKDVDGFHVNSLGGIMRGCSKFTPCTPMGAMLLLDHFSIDVNGKHCVVVGRSNILGKPLANLLINRGATVTICNSRTTELHKKTKQGDVVFLATGNAKMFTKKYFNSGAIVIDFGMNRDAKGKLCGDLDIDNVKDKIKAYTPVPKGMGLLTVTSLMINTIKAYKYQKNI